jgi:hypothetical protein
MGIAMIWFACKKCGKRHGRPESQAGTLVFCDCSYGNRVPWASTVAEPEPDANPAPIPLPPAPVPASRPSSYPEGSDERRPAERPWIRRQPRRENPRYCLNHEDAASEHTCADCKAAFCAGCVVTIQGQMLCGPCKNFRIRAMNRPARVSGLAIVSLVVGLVGGPVTFCVNTFSFGSQLTNPSAATAIALCVVGLLVPLGTLVLAWLALREMGAKPNTGGRSLALTGATCGVVGALWTLTIGGLLVVKHLSG